MSNLHKIILSVLGLCLLFGGTAAYNYLVWKECREQNTFMYCLKLVTK